MDLCSRTFAVYTTQPGLAIHRHHFRQPQFKNQSTFWLPRYILINLYIVFHCYQRELKSKNIIILNESKFQLDVNLNIQFSFIWFQLRKKTSLFNCRLFEYIISLGFGPPMDFNLGSSAWGAYRALGQTNIPMNWGSLVSAGVNVNPLLHPSVWDSLNPHRNSSINGSTSATPSVPPTGKWIILIIKRENSQRQVHQSIHIETN